MTRSLLKSLPALLALCAVGAVAELPTQGLTRTEPDHLVPVDPYPSKIHKRYYDQCHRLFEIGEVEKLELFQYLKRGAVVMLYMPTFRPEECIALKEESGAREYNLIYSRAERNIFDAMPEDDEEDKPLLVKIDKVVKPLDPVRARRVYDLWERMLKGVRYPEVGPRAGCPDDGDTFEFRYRFKGMYGETCSPSRGAPKLFADLGNSLILVCKCQDNDLQNNLINLDKKCAELETNLGAESKANAVQDATRKDQKPN